MENWVLIKRGAYYFLRTKLSYLLKIFLFFNFSSVLLTNLSYAQDAYLTSPQQIYYSNFYSANDSLPTNNDVNPRKAWPLGLSIYGGSPSIFVSLSADYFVRPNISLEFGGGIFGVFAGGRYHFWGKTDKNWTPYLGGMFAFYGKLIGVDYLFFFPVGLQYIGNKGFNFAVELSLISDHGPAYYPVWWGIKFGYRFKK